VLEPPELVERIRATLRVLNAAYPPPQGKPKASVPKPKG
jgi:hypothetical protein